MSGEWSGFIEVALFVPTSADLQVVLASLAELSLCGKVSARVSIHLAMPEDVWSSGSVAETVAHAPSTWDDALPASASARGTPADDGCVERSLATRGAMAGPPSHEDGVVRGDAGGDTNYARRVPYPNNMLRNLARSQATAPWTLVLDIDMVPGPPDLFQRWRDAGTRGLLRRGDHIAYVLPAFEVRLHSSSGGREGADTATATATATMPLSRADVLAAWNTTVRPFYFDPCWKCQRHTNYSEWLHSSGLGTDVSYHVPYHDPWEPFYISETSLTPAFDERFKQCVVTSAHACLPSLATALVLGWAEFNVCDCMLYIC
jgi:hypothetical protein